MPLPIETHEFGPYTVEIYIDEMPLNPRNEYENVGKMICLHFRYNLGDKHSSKDPCLATVEALSEVIPEIYEEDGMDEQSSAQLARLAQRGNDHPDFFALPLYLYDHSGITMRTTPFSCPWDSGRVGFIYTTRSKFAEAMGCDPATVTTERVEEVLRSEVQIYDHYLTGSVYGYSIKDENDDEVDSCWGFVGETSEAVEAAKENGVIPDEFIKETA